MNIYIKGLPLWVTQHEVLPPSSLLTVAGAHDVGPGVPGSSYKQLLVGYHEVPIKSKGGQGGEEQVVPTNPPGELQGPPPCSCMTVAGTTCSCSHATGKFSPKSICPPTNDEHAKLKA